MSKFDVKTCVNAAHNWDERARTGQRVGKLKPSKVKRHAKRAFARMQAAQTEVAQAAQVEAAQAQTTQVIEEK